ncbi:MAG: flagellar biosynthetic protein FliO [Pseudomonadota bacterium]|nr:flagellar biosynthetic protein FliO [Pseudomonadota bacterium]
MTGWFEGLGGPEFATAVLWTFAALILLVIVLVIIRLVRSMTFGTFVAGGRNRKTRLAVMDATAVDSHRRLVLVRRDDIEHLLLIGGPTDVVVEREIRLGQSRRSPSVFGSESAYEAPAPAPLPTSPIPAAPPQAPARQRAPEPMQLPALPIRGGAAPQSARAPERVPQPVRQPERPAQPPRPTRQTGARPPPIRETPLPPARSNPPRLSPVAPGHNIPGMSTTIRQPPPSKPPARSSSLDDALLRELEVSFDEAPPSTPAKPVEMTLDDEMTKLLGELSNKQ